MEKVHRKKKGHRFGRDKEKKFSNRKRSPRRAQACPRRSFQRKPTGAISTTRSRHRKGTNYATQGLPPVPFFSSAALFDSSLLPLALASGPSSNRLNLSLSSPPSNSSRGRAPRPPRPGHGHRNRAHLQKRQEKGGNEVVEMRPRGRDRGDHGGMKKKEKSDWK